MKNYQKFMTDQARAFYEAQAGKFEKDKKAPGGASDKPDFVKWLDQTGSLVAHAQQVSADWDKRTILSVAGQTRHKSQFGGAQEKAVEGFFQDLMHEVKRLHKKQTAAG